MVTRATANAITAALGLPNLTAAELASVATLRLRAGIADADAMATIRRAIAAAGGAAAAAGDDLAEIFNGPIRVGVAVGADTPTGGLATLLHGADLVATMLALPFDDGVEGPVKDIVRALAGYGAADPRRLDEACSTRGAPVAVAGAALPDADGLIQVACTLLISAKINWWTMNHHIGVPRPAGYFGKVWRNTAARMGFSLDSVANVNAIWCATHWFNTKGVLSAIGVPGIDQAEADCFDFDIGADVLLRVRSTPAGTARLCDSMEALKVIDAWGVFDFVRTASAAEIAEIEASVEAVENDPARYHVGSRYLTGSEQLACYVPTAEFVAKMKAVIEVAAPDHNLLLASCFQNSATDSTTTVLARAVHRAVRTARVDTAPIIARLGLVVE